MGKMQAFARYALNIGIWLDEGVSTLAFGDPHETISSRLGKAERGDFGRGWQAAMRPVAAAVDFVFSVGHCQSSIIDTVGGEAVFDQSKDGKV